MRTNEEAYLEALKAELAYVQAQPNVRTDRVADIKAEIAAREPVETATRESPETAVEAKPKRRTAKD